MYGVQDVRADMVGKVPTRTCENPVASQYQLGQRIGLTGTPMIIAADGTQMPGYLPPDALLATLKGLDAPPAKDGNASSGG